MALPIRTTANENVAAYQAERTIFLDEQRKFKIGFVQYGVATIASMRSMYMELIYAEHQAKDKAKSDAFVAELDTLYSQTATLYVNQEVQQPAKAIKNPQYLKAIRAIDESYSRLQLYKKECGFG